MRNVFVSTSFDSRMLATPDLASRVRMGTVPYERVLKLLNGALRQLVFIADSQLDAVTLAKAIPVPTAQGVSYHACMQRVLNKGDILLASARPGNHNEWFIIDILKDVDYAMTLDTTLEKDIDTLYQILCRVDGPIIQAPAVLKYRGYGETGQLVAAMLDIPKVDAAKAFIDTRGKRRAALYREQFVCAMAMDRHWG